MYGLLAGSNLDASSWLPFSDISQQRRVGLVWFPIVHVSIPNSLLSSGDSIWSIFVKMLILPFALVM